MLGVMHHDHPQGGGIAPAELAQLCKVSPRTVARWREAGLIHPHGRGRATRYSAADVMPLLRDRLHGGDAR